MSDRADFEKWRDDVVLRGKKDFTDMDWHLCWLGWQAARAQIGQGAEPAAWGSKPSKPGRYVVRGFDSAGTEALVCVAENDGELVCNLHDYNSDPLESYSNLMSEISDRFEWVELHTHPQPVQQGSVPEGWLLVPVDPTPEMREAFFKAQEECEDFEGVYGPVMPDHQYSAMLSVAPQPPQEGE